MRKACPRCACENVTIGVPFLLRSSVTGVGQTFVVVACRGRCLRENGASPRHKGRMCKEFRFRHAVGAQEKVLEGREG